MQQRYGARDRMRQKIREWCDFDITLGYTDEHENIFLIKISKYFHKFMGCAAVWGWMGERYGIGIAGGKRITI